MVFKEKQSDQSLLDGLKKGGPNNQKAEWQLYDAYAYFVREGQRKHSLNEEEAMDAYSDTIMIAIKKIKNGEFEEKSTLKTYLFSIFKFQCINLIRKKTTKKQTVHQTVWIEDLPNISFKVGNVLKSIIQQEKVDKLMRMLDKIGENCKKLLLDWGEGYSMEEIAVRHQLKNAGTAKTRKFKCLQQVKKSLSS